MRLLICIVHAVYAWSAISLVQLVNPDVRFMHKSATWVKPALLLRVEGWGTRLDPTHSAAIYLWFQCQSQTAGPHSQWGPESDRANLFSVKPCKRHKNSDGTTLTQISAPLCYAPNASPYSCHVSWRSVQNWRSNSWTSKCALPWLYRVVIGPAANSAK